MTRVPRSRTLVFLAAALTATLLSPATALAKEKKEPWKGKPDFNVGESRGYFIWGDQEGWHVRWMSKGKKRTFSGAVTSDVAIKGFNPVSRDSKDFIKKEGDRAVRFDAHAKEGIDGFDFHVSPSSRSITFELRIDGTKAPTEEVKLGRNKERATTVPFTIRLDGGEQSENIEKIEKKEKK